MEQNEQKDESNGHEDSDFWQQKIEKNQREEGNDGYEYISPPPLVTPQTIRVLRERPPLRPPLLRWALPIKASNLRKGKRRNKRKYNWSYENLVKAIDCYDVGYTMSDCCKAFNIPKSFLRNHLSEKNQEKYKHKQFLANKKCRWLLLI